MKLTIRNFRGIEARTLEWGTHLLLTGPHGRGKSTILDAIMVAYQGHVPRIGRDSAALRRLIGPHGDAAEVVLLTAKGAEIRRHITRTEAGAKIETTVRLPGQSAKVGKAAEAMLTAHMPAAYMMDMRILQGMSPKDRRMALAALVPGGAAEAILKMQDAVGEALDKSSTPEQILEGMTATVNGLVAKQRQAEQLLSTLASKGDPEGEALAGRIPEMQAERARLQATIAEHQATLRQSEQAKRSFEEGRSRLARVTAQQAQATEQAKGLAAAQTAMAKALARVAECEAAIPAEHEAASDLDELLAEMGRLTGRASGIKAFGVALKAGDGAVECPTCYQVVTPDDDTLAKLRQQWADTTAEAEQLKARVDAIQARTQAEKAAVFSAHKALRAAEDELRAAEMAVKDCARATELADELAAEIAELAALQPPAEQCGIGGIEKAVARVAELDGLIQRANESVATRKAIDSARPGDLAEQITAVKAKVAKAAKAYADWQSETLGEVAGDLSAHIRAMGIEADAAVRVDGKDVVFGLMKSGAWVPIEEVSGAEWLVLCLAMQAELTPDDGRACIFELSEGGLVLDKILGWAAERTFAPLAVATWATPDGWPDAFTHEVIS